MTDQDIDSRTDAVAAGTQTIEVESLPEHIWTLLKGARQHGYDAGRRAGIEEAIATVKKIRCSGNQSKNPIINALCSLRDGTL